MSNQLINLARYDLVGVCIALIVLLGFVIKLTGNHMKHNTDAITRHTATLEKLINVIEHLEALIK